MSRRLLAAALALGLAATCSAQPSQTAQPAQPAQAAQPAYAPPKPITLAEAYALALRRSEALAQDRELVEEALSRVEELKANVMPQLSFIAQHTFQENPHAQVSSINNTSIPNYYLQLHQPLFSGFREFLAFKSGRKTAEALRLTARRAESLLYQDVAQAYSNLEQAQNELAIRGAILQATADRIGQLERWVKIGRSRESEVLAARSQLAQSQAQVELARGSERVAQELLRFLLGEDSDFAARPVELPALEPLEPFLAKARSRDDVVASERSLEAAGIDVSVAARQRWGSLGLTADYYLKRLGFSANTHYDAVLGLNLPIFDGGLIGSQVRQAKARRRSAEQALSAARRGAERDARSAYVTLQWALAAVQALEKADQLAAENLKAQEQDYKLSLITNLQVLDSLSALQATRLQLSGAREQALLARARLEVAAGGPERPAQTENKP